MRHDDHYSQKKITAETHNFYFNAVEVRIYTNKKAPLYEVPDKISIAHYLFGWGV
jgi:hypothetical protein